MTNPIDEQLSALVDDELPAAEAPLLLRRLGQDAELRGRWSRYHLIGEAMRGALPGALDRDLPARVAAAVAAEPPAPVLAPRGIWLKRVGGGAVAATVAVVALLTLRVDEPVPATPELTTVAPPTANPQVQVGARFASTQGIHWEHPRPEVQQELNRYLLTHSDAAVQDGDGNGNGEGISQ